MTPILSSLHSDTKKLNVSLNKLSKDTSSANKKKRQKSGDRVAQSLKGVYVEYLSVRISEKLHRGARRKHVPFSSHKTNPIDP